MENDTLPYEAYKNLQNGKRWSRKYDSVPRDADSLLYPYSFFKALRTIKSWELHKQVIVRLKESRGMKALKANRDKIRGSNA